MIVSDMRAEASRQADNHAIEIILLAKAAKERGKDKTRFYKLRRRLTLPVNQRELDYVSALGRYVYYKLEIRRASFAFLNKNSDTWRYEYEIRNEMDQWRDIMRLIEYGFDYVMPAYATSNDSSRSVGPGNWSGHHRD